MPDILLVDELFTSAACRMPVSEVSSSDDCLLAAVAETEPTDVFPFFAVDVDGDEKPEPFSGYVEEAHFG
jgi:hypothetical protein